jgi:membrane-associated protein
LNFQLKCVTFFTARALNFRAEFLEGSVMEFLHLLKDHEEWARMMVKAGIIAYVVLFLIIYAETGLLVGFFLPGDSLLFVTGAVAAAHPDILNIWILIPLLIVAAITGDATGYWIGRKSGPALFNKPDSKLFKREHLVRTQAFYDKHGPKTIVLARFVPIVRTFAPVIAGIAEMDYRKFAYYNITGGIGWIVSMLLSGYLLGTIPIIKDNFEKAVLGIIFLSILPMIVHFVQERRKGKSEEAALVSTVAPGLEEN